MAPSSRTRTAQQQRPQVPVFRVTKSSRLNERPVSQLKQKINSIENVISENAPLPIPPVAPSLESAEVPVKTTKKRRRDSNSEDSTTDCNTCDSGSKRIKKSAISLLKTRKQNPKDEEQLPELLQELCQLHRHLMHALSVHYAHNKGGIRDVIDLAALLPPMTRLWRKRAVQVQDVQRILTLWELKELIHPDTAGSVAEVLHSQGPFRIEQVGVGLNGTTTLEYTWTNTAEAFVETELQRQYEDMIRRLFTAYKNQQRDEEALFIWQNLDDVPKLQCAMSNITQQRREKVASIKSQILSKTKTPSTTIQQQQQQPDLSGLSIHGPDSPPRNTNVTVKSRTMNLFDRVRAKQLLNSTAASFTPAQQLRQRALQRVPDLVDVLRLKQARKLTGQLTYEVQSLASAQMKVSFSFEALVQEIRDSLRAEVASDEIREGITILGRDMPDEWCRVYEMGSVKCVTLQGEAMSRKAIEEWCKSVSTQTGSK